MTTLLYKSGVRTASLILGGSTAGVLFSISAQAAEITDVGLTKDGIIESPANHVIYDNPSQGVRLNGGFSLMGFAAGTHNINYGSRTGNSHKSPAWWEATAAPSMTAEYDLPDNAGTLFGGVTAFYTMTRGNGDGDPAGSTPDHPEHFRLDNAYLGWRSGDLFADSLGENAFTFSFGRQSFQFGDGFLIGDGFTEQGKYGGYYIGPSHGFHSSAVLSFDSHGWHADLFHLKASEYNLLQGNYGEYQNTSLNGLNVDYTLNDRAQFGAAYVHAYNSWDRSRNGMDVYNVRAKGIPFEALPGFSLGGQYAWEDRDHGGNGHAWYGQASYAFQDTPWHPVISYRRAEYGENYDSMYNSFAGGWGSWYYGEIAGEYHISNNNMNIDMLKVAVQPADFVETGLIGYSFRRNKSTGSGSKNFSKEVNLYADWTLSDHFTLSTVYGIAFPDDAAKAEYGRKKNSQIAQVFATYAF
ncbi:hypothetical protein [Carnimonas nigrificans]|uniref:hypothetical protein n=1 Tax=Carnimonas nigrificans TaxID=64323 RepID=UPI000472038C|nr:hypothetical protein [Carnimonas nigrificans]